MKIYLRLKPGDDTLWIRPLNMTEYRTTVFPKIGHQIVTNVRDADVVIQEHYLQDVIHENTIIFQRLDAHELLQSVVDRFDRNEWVKGYMLSAWVPDSITGKVHAPVGHTSKPVQVLNTMPWGEFGGIRVKVKPEYEKIYDLSFSGCVHYGTDDGNIRHDYPSDHRQRLLSNWWRVASRKTVCVATGFPRVLSGSQHFDLIGNSKVVVSPWGYSELSWRDWEAVLGQAVLIKPRGFTETRTTLWPWHCAVPCAPDFSDLDKAFQAAMAMYKHSIEQRKRIAKVFADRMQNKRELALATVSAIEEILGKK